MNKKQLAFYKELLRRVCKDPDTYIGFCYHIYDMYDWFLWKKMTPIDPYRSSEGWKELYSRLPKHSGNGYAFPRNSKGWEKRIQILHDLIQEHE